MAKLFERTLIGEDEKLDSLVSEKKPWTLKTFPKEKNFGNNWKQAGTKKNRCDNYPLC